MVGDAARVSLAASSGASARRHDAALGEPPGPRGRGTRRAVSDAEKAERRAEILAAAKAVFAAKGYHATTVSDIAREAGLSYGSIYWYYESKEALFHELMSAEAAALGAHIEAAIAAAVGERDPEAPFRAAVRATLEFYEGDRALVKLLFRDAFALGTSFERHLFAINERFVDEIAAIVGKAQDRGVLVPGPTRLIAFAIAALVGQLAHRRLATDDGLPAQEVADLAVSILLNGLLPRRDPALSAAGSRRRDAAGAEGPGEPRR